MPSETLAAREEIQTARELLPQVKLIAGGRAGRAGTGAAAARSIRCGPRSRCSRPPARYAAADARAEATAADMRAVAPMALRLRRSQFMVDYFSAQHNEEEEIRLVIDLIIPE